MLSNASVRLLPDKLVESRKRRDGLQAVHAMVGQWAGRDSAP